MTYHESATNRIIDLSSDNYDVKFYKIDLHASDSSIYLRGSVTIVIEIVAQQVNKISFELVDNYTVDSVFADNKHAQFQHYSDSVTVELSQIYMKGQTTEVTIFYHGKGYNSGMAKGIFNNDVFSYHKRYTWTLSEPFFAKYWFPCKQELTDKADSVYVYITTDEHLKAGSNGVLENIVGLPDGKVRYEWESRYPIAYYLISFALGDYLDYSFYVTCPGGDSVLVQNYVYNDSDYFKENKGKIDKTTDLLNCFNELFGMYPFANEKYGHCVVPLGGGMEHQTMTTISNFSFKLVSHELAHQWFGDNVTCASWQDIWINEGFASYAEYLALEYLESKKDANDWMARAHDAIKNRLVGSIYIPAEDALNERRIFNGVLSYKKGAAIIHMIRQEIGNDALFFKILKDFLTVYQRKNAGAEDFKAIVESNTGMSFDSFFEQWYYGEGYPRFKINYVAKNDSLYIFSNQETTSSKTTFFNTLIEFSVQLPAGKDTIMSFKQESNFQEYKCYLPYNIQNLIFDPNKWLLADLDVKVVGASLKAGRKIFK